MARESRGFRPMTRAPRAAWSAESGLSIDAGNQPARPLPVLAVFVTELLDQETLFALHPPPHHEAGHDRGPDSELTLEDQRQPEHDEQEPEVAGVPDAFIEAGGAQRVLLLKRDVEREPPAEFEHRLRADRGAGGQ